MVMGKEKVFSIRFTMVEMDREWESITEPMVVETDKEWGFITSYTEREIIITMGFTIISIVTIGTAQKIGIYSKVNVINSSNAIALHAEVSDPNATGALAGYFYGDVTVVGEVTETPSDRRLKKNIRPMTPSLNKLLNLQPVTFEYNHRELPFPKGQQLGLIAQDVEQVFPNVVRETTYRLSTPDTDEGASAKTAASTETYKVIDYEELIPVLIQSIQEQQTQIEALQKELAELKAQQN